MLARLLVCFEEELQLYACLKLGTYLSTYLNPNYLFTAERISLSVDHNKTVLFALQAEAQPDKDLHNAFLLKLGYQVHSAPYIDINVTTIPNWFKVRSN